MDERRIEQALRQGPPDEPAYDAGIRARIASGDGARAPRAINDADVAPGTFVPTPLDQATVRPRPIARPGSRSWPLGIAASILLVVATVGVIGIAALGESRPAGPGTVDALARIQEANVVRVAVRRGAPQVVTAGGSYAGFDVDVASAIADELGVRGAVELVESSIPPTDGWDLALTGSGEPGDGVLRSQPYAYWHGWLVGTLGSVAADGETLAGARVCVVRESAGESWIGGVGGATTPPPAVVTAPDDASCLDALEAGTVDALVTATLLPDDIAALGPSLVVGRPVTTEPWSVAVTAPPGADPAPLLAAVDAAIDRLQASGRLEELSRSSFGGVDVTVPQP